MADAAVEFLLENLKQLLVHHAHLLKGAKDQVEKLENNLRLFKAFLKDAPKQWREDDTLRELIRRIRNAVYEAEDIIDAYVTQAAEAKNKGYFLRAIHGPPKIVSIAEKVAAVLKKIDDIYADKSRILDFASIKVQDGGGTDDNERRCHHHHTIRAPPPPPFARASVCSPLRAASARRSPSRTPAAARFAKL